MRFTVNIDFQGLCAIVPDGTGVSVLMVASPRMHRHHPRLWVNNECLDIGDVPRFDRLEPSSQGFLISSCDFSRCVATIGKAGDRPSACDRGIQQQQYPDERDSDDCFWIPSFADFTANCAVVPGALGRVPNRYVVARVDVSVGNFVSLGHLTSRGRFSRFIFDDPKGDGCAKAFADSVRLVVESESAPFGVRIRSRRGAKVRSHVLKLSPAANGTAWMAFTNLPSRPATSTDPMEHMPLFRKLLPKPWPPKTAMPRIDGTTPTFGDTKTWLLNVHTSTCPPATFAAPSSTAVALRGKSGRKAR